MKMNNMKSWGIGKVAVAATLLVTSACNKGDFSGPELALASDAFALTQGFAANIDVANNESVNFGSDETVGFSAGFNEKVSWKVTVTGLRSGAKKVFEGVSMGFADTEVVFEGRADGVPFFGNDEFVKAELTVMGHDPVYLVDSIETIKSFSYHLKTISGVKHIVIDNFEQAGGFKYSPVSLAVSTDAADSDIEFIADTNIVVEGERSFKMAGRDDNDNGWSGGMNSENLVDFYLFSGTNQLRIDSGISPEDLYFNMYIYGTGKANTTVQFKVYEMDYRVDENGDSLKTREDIRAYIFEQPVGSPPLARIPYDQSVNDGWIYDQEVTWTGWKMVSVPYSEFRAANDLLFGGNGDRVKESWRICGMAISLLSFPTTGALTETYIDELVITQGGRFQQ